MVLDNNVTEGVITKFDVEITIISMIFHHILTFIDQTLTIHLHIFLIIAGSFILSVIIIILCYKLFSNRFLYSSTQTQVSSYIV